MLAPLEDRSILARAGDETRSGRRRGPRRPALHAELARLRALCERQQRQLEGYAAGLPIVELGRKLMELSEANRLLRGDALRAVKLARILELSRTECLRLHAERDALARELHRLRTAAVER
ncbi:hypothetical protein [Azospira restricta]|uniref:Uncharacterized protein n=1 Tax=Azospira restricta TaxID=404405 RepID=A0A974SML1_9RHOO|nr:hypothetical protein [Azospira restricta]QRJ63176.1 hypothetical protein IWH25_15700 [Azospira restricta]